MNEYNFGYNPQIGFDLWRKQQNAPLEVAEGAFNVGYDPMTDNVQQPFGGQPQAIEPQEELGFFEKLQANPRYGDALMGAGRAMVGGASRLPQSGMQRLSAGVQAFGDGMFKKTNEMEDLKKAKIYADIEKTQAEINKLNNPVYPDKRTQVERDATALINQGIDPKRAYAIASGTSPAKDYSKEVRSDLYNQSKNLQKEKTDINSTLSLVKSMSSKDFGALGGQKLALKKLATALGYEGFSDTELADGDFLQNRQNEFVLGNIAQTKGAISEKEMEIFKNASPNLQNTKAGNLKLLDFLKLNNEAKYEKVRLMREAINKNGGLANEGMELEVQKIIDDKYTPKFEALYKGVLKRGKDGNLVEIESTQPTNKGGTGVVIPQGAIDFLLKNKHRRQEFDERYGKGASEKYLRGGK